jgi:hypothetical protein
MGGRTQGFLREYRRLDLLLFEAAAGCYNQVGFLKEMQVWERREWNWQSPALACPKRVKAQVA